MSSTFSQSDVAAHKKPDDLWVIVDEDVYDLTKFQSEHPGVLHASLLLALLWPLQLTPARWTEKYDCYVRMLITC